MSHIHTYIHTYESIHNRQRTSTIINGYRVEILVCSGTRSARARNNDNLGPNNRKPYQSSPAGTRDYPCRLPSARFFWVVFAQTRPTSNSAQPGFTCFPSPRPITCVLRTIPPKGARSVCRWVYHIHNSTYLYEWDNSQALIRRRPPQVKHPSSRSKAYSITYHHLLFPLLFSHILFLTTFINIIISNFTLYRSLSFDTFAPARVVRQHRSALVDAPCRPS